MRLTLSEKLLCDIFELCLSVNDILIGSPRNIKEAWYPELIQRRKEFERKNLRRTFYTLVSRLKRAGYIRVREVEGKKGILLTQKGAERVLKIKLESEEKQKREDGKWVMVAFDIPERRRRIRDEFRSLLLILGFRMFQKSVWVCPYDVLERVQQLTQKFFLERAVKIFLIEEVEIT